MITECNNQSSCHKPIVIKEDESAMRVLCTECKNQYVIRKDWRGVVDNIQYSKIFKREILQPNSNLFYRYYPQHLKT